MKTNEIKVVFQPSGRSVFVLPGTLLLEAAGRAGIVLQTPCGGRGTCGKCKVRITGGACAPSSAGKQELSAAQIDEGYRLACQSYVTEPLVVDIPPESRFEAGEQILTSHAGEKATLEPIVSKRFFELDAPTSRDAISLVTDGNETNFMIVPAEDSGNGEPIFLWQKDVRELQLATGAIRAGINLLLRRVGLAPDDIHSVLLAGAFGNFIRRNNARRIGLLPQIPCGRIQFIGNAASLGAKLALLSSGERERATRLRQGAEHVDLSLDPEFQMEFGMAMMFPADDVDACVEDVHE
ncbi:MAG: ASKHA domain-containing protein [Candidatus Pacebacteria bacterium]|nr:ASKHA domain-containing protein [Candidatus Paceibacterota bacterium]